ncbi:phage head-tail connector protein [Diplocloster modestus]
MYSNVNLGILKNLTGESEKDLMTVLQEAEDFVLSYTNRTHMIVQLEKTVRDLAVIALNRTGTEGETARSEGGETYSFDTAPRHIYDVLNRYRLARVGGKTHEAKT